MKPLTIEELKALGNNDWVWVIWLANNNGYYLRLRLKDEVSIGEDEGDDYAYEEYNKTWIAYKNKEQAEADKDKCPDFLRVGNPVYYLWQGRKEVYQITAIEYSPNYGWAFYVDDEDHSRIWLDDPEIGKTIFFSEEIIDRVIKRSQQ